jgi:predicted nuclease with TOPRIM domain
MSKHFEKEVLLTIKRELSQTEKHNILMQSYRKLEDKLESCKDQITKLQHNNHTYKKQYAELQNKYLKLCKKYNTEEYAPSEKL